jgi:hypothetical protein
MNRFNISQATYDRIYGGLARGARANNIDVRDLLRAYEDAIELLDETLSVAGMDMGADLEAETSGFLYLDNGQPRVTLDGA